MKHAAQHRLQCDQHGHLAVQADKAQYLWPLVKIYKHVQGMFKQKQARLMSKDGSITLRSVQEQMGRLQEYFQEVFTSESMSPEQQRRMELLISNAEASLPANSSSSHLHSASSNADSRNANATYSGAHNLSGAAAMPLLEEVADLIPDLEWCSWWPGWHYCSVVESGGCNYSMVA